MKYVITLLLTVFLSGCVSDKSVFEQANAKQRVDEIRRLSAPNSRQVDVRYIEPDGCQSCPLIIFSHGANAAYDRYDDYLIPLSEKGYRIAAPNHVDSEEHPQRAEFKPQDYMPTRIVDYELIAAQFDAQQLVAVGHSFGAYIAQIAGGGAHTLGQEKAPRYPARAVIALSPPGPIKGYIAEQDWSTINRPHLVVTGTEDVVPGVAETWQAHLVSYQQTPVGLAYALIYNNMDHYFNGAYGRETGQHTVFRQAAIRHLVTASDEFIKRALSGEPPVNNAWGDQANDHVKAMSK